MQATLPSSASCRQSQCYTSLELESHGADHELVRNGVHHRGVEQLILHLGSPRSPNAVAGSATGYDRDNPPPNLCSLIRRRPWRPEARECFFQQNQNRLLQKQSVAEVK